MRVIYNSEGMSEGSMSFCYVDVHCLADAVTVGVLLCLSGVLGGLGVRQYCMVRGSRGHAVRWVYGSVFAWWLLYAAKDLFSIILFAVKSSLAATQVSAISKAYFAVDWLDTFVLQALLVYVPYHCMKKLAEISAAQRASAFDDERQETDSASRLCTPHPFILVYMRLRALALIPLIVFLAVSNEKDQEIASKTLMWVLLVDCIAIIVTMSLGIYSLKTNTSMEHLDPDQVKRMLNQYFIMMAATGIRFAADLSLTISVVFSNTLLSDNCGSSVDFNLLLFLELIVVCIFTHYLPVFIILRIYVVQDTPVELSKSLLISADCS